MVIGITGNSGTGKTEIAKILANKLGAVIIDADRVVKEMTDSDSIYLREIVKVFGEDILVNNKLNRKKLADIIYSNSSMKNELDCLTFRYVAHEIKDRIKRSDNDNIILDAPLLFESKLNEICNFTVSVLADISIKIDRICKRDNISKELAKARLNIQSSDDFYIKKSNFIIVNNGKIEEINLEELCTKIGLN